MVMPNLRHWLVALVGRTLNVTIVRAGAVGPLFERDHLKLFFASFGVDCVFDVGANEGQYAQMLRRFGYAGPIVSFEPIPSAAMNLRAKAKHDPLWFIEEVALDEAERRVSFNVMRNSQFSSLLAPSTEDTGKFIEMNAVAYSVELVTRELSSFYDVYKAKLGFTHPFLKMDTQGNDLSVARGAGSRLQYFVGLQSEMAVKKLYDRAVDYRAALAFYLDQDFEISAFVPNNRGHFPALIEFDCIMYNVNRFQTSVVVLPVTVES